MQLQFMHNSLHRLLVFAVIPAVKMFNCFQRAAALFSLQGFSRFVALSCKLLKMRADLSPLLCHLVKLQVVCFLIWLLDDAFSYCTNEQFPNLQGEPMLRCK